VPIAKLIVEPYNLPWGSNIHATVSAINIIGASEHSDAGNGAIILTHPDAPYDLENVPAITAKHQVGLQWESLSESGGAPVLDFRVNYAAGADDYLVLESGITTKSYTATGLSAGVTYHFKVEARNEYGYSDFSNEVSILAAQTPVQPNAPTTTVNGPVVDIDWTEPYDNGSPIFGYIITIRQSDDVTFQTETTSCDGSNPSIVASRHCSVPIATLKAASF